MSRELKFRAWNFVAKKMYYPENAGNIFLWQKEGQVQEIMQYTGRKDKNRNDIYEGDIVKTDSGALMKVCYREDMCRFVLRFNDHSASSDLDNDLEVIGNIYENPELLNPSVK